MATVSKVGGRTRKMKKLSPWIQAAKTYWKTAKKGGMSYSEMLTSDEFRKFYNENYEEKKDGGDLPILPPAEEVKEPVETATEEPVEPAPAVEESKAPEESVETAPVELSPEAPAEEASVEPAPAEEASAEEESKVPPPIAGGKKNRKSAKKAFKKAAKKSSKKESKKARKSKKQPRM